MTDKIVAARHCPQRHTWLEIQAALRPDAESTGAVRRPYIDRDKSKYPPDFMPIPCPICSQAQMEDVIVEGVTPFELAGDIEELWETALKAQARSERLEQLREEQRITIPGSEPFAWAYLSDLHLGGDTDYRAIQRDVQIIRDTPRMWCSFHGDGVDNWIVSKLQRLQRRQSLTHDQEWQLFLWLLGPGLENKLKVVVPGNHELWTLVLAGLDRLKEGLAGTRLLYDTHEVSYDVILDGVSWRTKQRHSWRGTSVFNVTHGIEVGWERGTCEFDIGIGGHTHQGTVCRPFIRHGELKYALLTGTYSRGDYGRELGMGKTCGRGSGAMIHFPDGRLQFFQDLEVAARFLQFLNQD